MSTGIPKTAASIILALSQLILIEYTAEAMGKSRSNVSMIEFTHVPKYGSTESLRGRMSNGHREDFAIAVYIMVDGSWWTKPYWDSPLTQIHSDGTWVCDITTGGIDQTAAKIVAYLVPCAYKPPLAAGSYRLPEELEKNSVSKAEAVRTAQGKVFAASAPNDEQVSVPRTTSPGRLTGVCYGPFRDNENPDMGIYPTVQEIEADLKLVPQVAAAIRTYGSTSTPARIPELCAKAGIDLYPGAWLGKYKTENKMEVASILQIAGQNFKQVKGLIIGNEVLLRKDMTEDELIGYLREVKSSTRVPVTTAEIWTVWLRHAKLADEVDFLMVHIHPYWEGVPIEEAAEHVVKVWAEMKAAFPGKRVIIGETGWPAEGKAVKRAIPSQENQARFLKDFIRLAGSNGIEYFYFELFDEKWKDKFEGEAGAHWGIYTSNGSLKDSLKDLIPVHAVREISRPPRKVEKVEVTAPLVVYSDSDSDKNRFQPSGWMGDIECVDLDKACEADPHSGRTCVRITWSPGRLFSQGWSGIYWQYPLNNWGEYPGYRLSGASKVTFWARGAKGGEKAEFKAGGIRSFGKPHRDSFGPSSTGTLNLTREWREYTIDLTGEDTSNVIGGFCWTANNRQNPKGCTIYLDDIVFE